ncbi:MAG: hypothetical protein J6X86_00390 [Bacteroidales bacterium]|nr:hypothetical protein [Bacteroidales bacterium]
MKYLICLCFLIQTTLCLAQKEESTLFNRFLIEPHLYNEYVSKSTQVDYWTNYWYTSDQVDTTRRIPNQLLINMHLYTDMDVMSGELDSVIFGKCIVESSISFKYGEMDNSFYVVNPKRTDGYTLMNDTIDLDAAIKYVQQAKDPAYSIIKTIKVPMKEILWKHGISINEYEEPTESYGTAVNQLIIYTVMKDLQGKKQRTFEFTLPISGCFVDNDKNSGWEF